MSRIKLVIDEFIHKMPDSDTRESLIAFRNAFNNGNTQSLKMIRIIMRDYINEFVREESKTAEITSLGFGYYDDSEPELEEAAPASSPWTTEIPVDNVVKDNRSKEVSGEKKTFSFSEDSASDAFEGISFQDVLVDDPYDFESDDPFSERGRVNPPLDLSAFMQLPGLEDPKKVIGIDIAAYGDDSTWFAFRHGSHIVDIWKLSKRDPMEVCGYIVQAVDEFSPDEIVIDDTGGLGTGVVARLEELEIDEKCIITPVSFNAKPRDEANRVLNQRAEMYYLLERRFRNGDITLPMNKELIQDLAYITYKHRSDGSTLQIEDKKSIKKELGRSPDGADAVALAFYEQGTLEIFF